MQILVNGDLEDVAVSAGESLLTTLRERLHLRGTKLACDRGECGACTVLLDGEPVYACLTLTEACSSATITTIEGLAARKGGMVELHPVQRAFVACDAVQCGYCTPGQILSAVALLHRNPDPSEEAIAEAMSGNLCRCGTYPAISRAIHMVASERRAAGG